MATERISQAANCEIPSLAIEFQQWQKGLEPSGNVLSIISSISSISIIPRLSKQWGVIPPLRLDLFNNDDVGQWNSRNEKHILPVKS